MSMVVPAPLAAYPNVHRTLIRAAFGDRPADLSAIPAATRFVLICFTNRCGSNFLAEALASSGHLNVAGEHLNGDAVAARAGARQLPDFGAYLAWLIGEQARNGVLVLKAAVTQLALLAELGVLGHILPRTRFVLIERSDKLAQAISYAIAHATGQWSAAQPMQVAPDDVAFSAKLVRDVLEGTMTQMGLFGRFFALNDIVPVSVNYEMLDRLPAAMVTMIGQELGLPQLRYVPEAMRLRRQSGPVNELWRRRFLESVAVTG